MTTELVVRETGQEITRLEPEQIKFLANTEFVQKGVRGNLPAIFATIATGRELGLGDMASLRHVHVIDGKPGYSAEIMVVLARRAGHSITGEVDATRALVRGRRADNGDEMTCEWTLDMAQKAGLLSKSVWQKYPQSLLWARAVSQLCRMLFADCFAGATYVPEELEESAGEPATSSSMGIEADVQQADKPGEPLTEPDLVSQAGQSEPASPADEIAAEVFGDTEPARPDDGRPPTEKQIKYLNATVGPMAEEDKHRVWATIALFRVRAKDDLIAELGGFYTKDGEPAPRLHWPPLRDSLTKDEASRLIDRLEAHEREQA
jgi:hypothetical protein